MHRSNAPSEKNKFLIADWEQRITTFGRNKIAIPSVNNFICLVHLPVDVFRHPACVLTNRSHNRRVCLLSDEANPYARYALVARVLAALAPC